MARGPDGTTGHDNPRSPWGGSSLARKKIAGGDERIESLTFFDRWCQLTFVNQDSSNRLILRQLKCSDMPAWSNAE